MPFQANHFIFICCTLALAIDKLLINRDLDFVRHDTLLTVWLKLRKFNSNRVQGSRRECLWALWAPLRSDRRHLR
jgi:hypothetical protein